MPETPKIMLDAGHYAYSNQSPLVPEYWESQRMWVLCEYLAEELALYGFEVLKTRDDINKDLSLYRRGYMAKGCDLFLSLHSNAVGGTGGESVDRVDVYAPYDNINNSHELGLMLANAIADTMKVSKGYVKTRKSDKGDFDYYGVLYGARSAKCPLFYILEHSFHTNEYAAKWLLEDENLRKLAVVEAAVIAAYFGMEMKYRLGDVNQSGKIDISDIVLIKRAMLGTYTLSDEQMKLSDINGDGKVTISDYILAKRMLLGTYDPNGAKTDNSADPFKIGDKVRVNEGVTAFANGKPMKEWVLDALLYVRDIENGGKALLISTEPNGNDYTGRVNACDVHRV